ncbi:angiopoietin-related protein 4 [Erpetoichthys calabaricus]|uniref:angiopoietin-related protein 4 n=1 Tax=Erpetoichthys calabaricus TaxID=27687 RepID=UPI0022342FE5|nr:angiopoietin-related protein 4 [Erpetoichthys calabaricus]
MKFPVALVLCTAALLEPGSSFPNAERKGAPGKEKKVQYASWDEVNVIAHGLLQLGHGLKEHVDKTKGQIKDISGKMSSFNSTVAELSMQSKQLQVDGEALKARAQGLEEKESLAANISEELKQRAEQLETDSKRVNERMSRLEDMLNGLLKAEGSNASTSNGSQADLHSLQFQLEAQTRRIDELVERIRQQQEKLDKQNARIRTLQFQVEQNRVSSPRWKSVLKRRVDINEAAEQLSNSTGLSVDCHDLFLKGERQSGLYAIQPVNSQPFQAYCEMTDEGGWTVIQRRRDGSVDFDQLWQDYKNGFGDFNGEFWLGLERIRALTQQGGYVLHIELKDWSDQTQFIEFPFSLGGENTSYSLYVQGVATGSVENALTNDLTGVPFSTRDRDNDLKQDINCAKHLSGGWWFSNCGRANLNGKYFSRIPRQRHERKQGVFWKTWRGRYYPLKSTLMKIAPAELEYES